MQRPQKLLKHDILKEMHIVKKYNLITIFLKNFFLDTNYKRQNTQVKKIY